MCMDTWHLVLSAGVAPACITKLYSDATAFCGRMLTEHTAKVCVPSAGLRRGEMRNMKFKTNLRKEDSANRGNRNHS